MTDDEKRTGLAVLDLIWCKNADWQAWDVHCDSWEEPRFSSEEAVKIFLLGTRLGENWKEEGRELVR